MNEAASVGSTRPIIPAGTQLNGIYEIDEPIAAGGMGEVYKGHSIQTGDIVAIKLIRPDLAEAEAAFALFRREAAALHNLYHEAIVRYYVFTVDPALERPYLAMEYVEGQSLSAILRGGPLPFEAVQRLMQRVAAGLEAAHECGIVHRDVSPDNIIVPAGDMARAKIIDFGIARSTRLDDEGTVIGTGFAGKYNYVSPEQLGLYGGEVNPKSDIYSLGLVLAEALRNGPIDMGGNHVDVIEKRRVVPDVGPIDQRLRPLIEQMLQPNPDDRPASMAEVAAWTGDAASMRRARRRIRPPRARPDWVRVLGRTPAILAGAALIGVMAAAPGFYRILRPPPPAIPLAPLLQSESASSPGRQAAAANPAKESRQVKAGLAPMNLPQLSLDRPRAAAGNAADPERALRLRALVNSINRYDGGDCFFAKPLALNDASAMIEGFGSSTVPFRGLDDAFQRANGFEADIGVRQVDPAQCPAITFLERLRDSPAPPVKLDLAAMSLTVGQPLAGTVSGLNGRQANVVLVADDGSVRALPVTPVAGRDGALSFSSRTGADLGNGKLQLVLAIASPKSLGSLRGDKPGAAAKLFPQALREAEQTSQPLAAAAQSFEVQK